jgi:hypothetical protein
MSGKRRQIDLEFQYSVKMLCGYVNEGHFQEKYVQFWRFIALLFFPKNEILRHDLKICAVANIISSLVDGRLPRSIDRDEEQKKLIELEFTPEVCARTICNLATDEGFAEYIEACIESMNGASLISEALLRLSVVQHTDPKRGASLAKAYHLVKFGGFHSDEELAKKSEVASDASLKNYWKQWSETLPFAHAFNALEIDVLEWSPFERDGLKNYLRDLRKRPDIFKQIFGTARSVQDQIRNLLDQSARKPPFFAFPPETAVVDWRAEPLDSRQIEIMKSYKSENKIVFKKVTAT